MINFKSNGSYRISDTERVYTVINPLRSDEWAWCDSYDFLIGKLVNIDSVTYTVYGVERFAHGITPKPFGENIGLLA